jgi:hypothetical protein
LVKDYNGDMTTPIKPIRYTRTKTTYFHPKDKVIYSTPILDTTLQNVVEWCSTSNSTLIDGGNIYADSVSAGIINTNAVRSLNYIANPWQFGKIENG